MLSDPYKETFEKVARFGFAIKRTSASQFHVGMLYKVDKKEPRLRHHPGHLMEVKDVKAEDFDYLWANIAYLSDVNKRLLANKLSRAGTDKIPYGVGYHQGASYIDKNTLRYLHTEPGKGLTCVSYIVAVLETLGFFPFNLNGWVVTEEDQCWQVGIINKFEKIELERMRGGDSQKLADPTTENSGEETVTDENAEIEAKVQTHFNAERDNIGSARMRPDHIMGSAFAESWPLTFELANNLGEKVIVSYNECRKF